MSGGVPRRVQISRTQRNTPSKAGNVVAKKAIVLCSGRRSRRAMCNYIKQRAKTCAICPSGNIIPPWWYNNPEVLQAVSALSAFLLSQSPPLVLSLVGRHEHLSTDLGPHLGDYGLTLDDDFNHYEAGHTEYDNLPPQMQSYANIINSIKLSRSIIPGGPSRLHIAGAVTQNAKNVLKNKTIFGLTIWLSRNTNIIAYANGLSCCYDVDTGGSSAPNGVIFEADTSATYGFKFIGYEDSIIENKKLEFPCDDCCTARANTGCAWYEPCYYLPPICTESGCFESPEYIYQWKGHPMIKDDPMVIGSNPPVSGDSDLWKTIWEQDYTEAMGFLNNNIGAKPAYTIIGNSCTL